MPATCPVSLTPYAHAIPGVVDAIRDAVWLEVLKQSGATSVPEHRFVRWDQGTTGGGRVDVESVRLAVQERGPGGRWELSDCVGSHARFTSSRTIEQHKR